MTPLPKSAPPISPAQVQRLQALWHHWTARLGLEPEADRRLRHYYVELLSGGRAAETKQLTRADAARVIAWLERLSRRRARAENQAAGTAGRHGFPERRGVARAAGRGRRSGDEPAETQRVHPQPLCKRRLGGHGRPAHHGGLEPRLMGARSHPASRPTAPPCRRHFRSESRIVSYPRSVEASPPGQKQS